VGPCRLERAKPPRLEPFANYAASPLALHRKVELEQDLSGSVGDGDQPLGALPSILASDEVTKNSERFITGLCKPWKLDSLFV
jgi:hypothetical protein